MFELRTPYNHTNIDHIIWGFNRDTDHIIWGFNRDIAPHMGVLHQHSNSLEDIFEHVQVYVSVGVNELILTCLVLDRTIHACQFWWATQWYKSLTDHLSEINRNKSLRAVYWLPGGQSGCLNHYARLRSSVLSKTVYNAYS